MKEFIENNKYLLAIILCVAIIGGAMVYDQNAKQVSIEKQKQMEIDQANKVLADKQADKSWNKMMIDACLADAEDSYWKFMELNGTGKRNDPKGVTALTRFWDTAKADRKDAQDNCYKKYSF